MADQGHRSATYAEKRTRLVRAPAETLWDEVAHFGGRGGYPAFDQLWQWRALADRFVGGPGMRDRPGGTPQAGDVLDFWRVEEVEPPRSLLLRAEMRLPGTAWLGLEVRDAGTGRSLLLQRTWFAPGWGPLGHVFWWAELPGHAVVFARMCDGLAEAAERRAA